MLHFEVFGSQGLTVGGQEIIPSTDLVKIYEMLDSMNISCVWTGKCTTNLFTEILLKEYWVSAFASATAIVSTTELVPFISFA